MRAKMTENGLSVQIIAGTHNAIIGIDLQEENRIGCLGFSIERTDLGNGQNSKAKADAPRRWLPNMLQFPNATAEAPTTENAPLQKFRWGDYTLKPGHTYRYRVIPKYGTPEKLTTSEKFPNGIEVEITTECIDRADHSIFFNRGAAASKAFEAKFPKIDLEDMDNAETINAKKWLSRGLEEALIAFLRMATNSSWVIHAAIYEFQKSEFVSEIKNAVERGVEVRIIYHARDRGEKDHTRERNESAIKEAKLENVVIPRKSSPSNAIMHNKFVILLQKDSNKILPKAVWTGSTNWTDGAIYGQLNVGHAIYIESVAETYEKYFQILNEDPDSATIKNALAELAPVPEKLLEEAHITPMLSPQKDDSMLHLYARLCAGASSLLISAPFALSPIIRDTLYQEDGPKLRFFLIDKNLALGESEEIEVIQRSPANSIAAAVTLKSPIHDYQGKLLSGNESFHHRGIHIHTKVILVDPFGDDPIVVTGSANFSNNSTVENDSNTLVIRGDTVVADIYSTEFMRMFEHYHFRAKQAANPRNKFFLIENDSWTEKFYIPGSLKEEDRLLFSGRYNKGA